jgi:transcriptional regulator with XRE-family HTH domain
MRDNFAVRLIRMRSQKGLRSADLARLMGVSGGMLWNLEAGKVQPAGRTLVKACRVLECSADYLLCLSDNPELK